MNPDECRKAFEDEYGDSAQQYDWLVWQNAWGACRNSRTESKPVTWEEIDELAGQMEDCISFDESGNFCGFNHKQAENILFKVLHLPAPQSPVVPGVEELSRVFMKGARSNWTKPDNPHDADDQPLSIDDGVKAIHAHLLATGGHQSREDNALKKELDELQRKAFNEYVDMANRYRQALERVKGRLEAMECDDWIGYTEIVEALATTSPNDGSGRG